MIDLIYEEAEDRMQKSVEALRVAFTKVRTGRAHTSLLDHVSVPYYGSDTPLSQVANVTVLDSRTLGITPWEKQMVSTIEKAIIDSGLGLNPSSAGTLIRIPLPPMTEDRRRDLTRVVKNEAEGGRVAVRNIRRDSNAQLKNMVKDKDISEDDERQALDVVQKMTDKYIGQIETILEEKEKELMEV
jgi:ribosome recycling factor